jgi:cytochrome c5
MRTSPFFCRSAAIATLLTLAMAVSSAIAADKTGREVVEQVCAKCHASGKDGAPKIGDVGAWTQHAKQGLGRLAEHAISGIRKMPAHGGQPSLTDLEISRAIATMVSFGHAVDPNKPFASPQTISAEQLVYDHCLGCHGPGKDGAPRMGDFEAWRPRLQLGIEGLVRSATTGHKAMPARSGMGALSDTDLRNAITYMVVQSASSKAK